MPVLSCSFSNCGGETTIDVHSAFLFIQRGKVGTKAMGRKGLYFVHGISMRSGLLP